MRRGVTSEGFHHVELVVVEVVERILNFRVLVFLSLLLLAREGSSRSRSMRRPPSIVVVSTQKSTER